MLPTTSTILDVSNQGLITLPPLPENLTGLCCRNNKLKSLPPLPLTLEYLDCDDNQIESLPVELPETLEILHCANNKLKFLPDNLDNLAQLECHNNPFTAKTLQKIISFYDEYFNKIPLKYKEKCPSLRYLDKLDENNTISQYKYKQILEQKKRECNGLLQIALTRNILQEHCVDVAEYLGITTRG
jgi:Leucine-rich repeat (LRR) protein